jgi:hypothetical protein
VKLSTSIYLAPESKITQLHSHFVASHKENCSVYSLLGFLTIQFITKNRISFKGSVIIILVYAMKKIKHSVAGRRVQNLQDQHLKSTPTLVMFHI